MSLPKKIISIAGLLVIVYGYGITTMQLEIFPYSEIRFVYERMSNLKNVSNSDSDRNRQMSTDAAQSRVDENQKIGVFLTYGQSNSANHGQYGYEVKSDSIYMFMNEKTYIYHDPAIGGSGNDGSVWGRLGDLLIANGYYDAVVFSVTGYKAQTIDQLSRPPYIDFMLNQYNGLIKEFGKVDGLLIHQGESNHRKNTSLDYASGFEQLMSELPDKLKDNIFLSRASYCGSGGTDTDVTNAQNNIIKANGNVHPGPDTDSLIEKQYRLPDRCHLSSEGLDRFAILWLESLEKHLIPEAP